MRPYLQWLGLILLPLFSSDVLRADGEIDYSREIEPLFAQHCLHCHGNDPAERQADLRLDDESSAMESAIVRGRPGDSPLIHRITSDDMELRMPPGNVPSLDAAEISLLRKWIAEGAAYETHWAWKPITNPTPPPGIKARSDIDRFVVQRLQANGLRLSPAATKAHLIRRATFDLTGLPPAWQDVVTFVNDKSPLAFERVIDRLLGSRAYGERWGRYWLDIARYADTHGGAAIGFKRFPFSYTYRDYVIRAFHHDVPYDQFVREQLAADQIGKLETPETLAALGFLTVGMQFRNVHDVVDDQIDVVTRGLLGLTVSCARCHDHKFDAIPTSDYYSLYAVFSRSSRPNVLPVIGRAASADEQQVYVEKLQKLRASNRDFIREQGVILRDRLRMQVALYLTELAKGVAEQELNDENVLSYRTDDLRPIVVERWRRYLEAMSGDDPVFGLWVQLKNWSGDPRNAESEQAGANAFAEKLDQLLEKMVSENGEPASSWNRFASDPPPWNPRVLETMQASKPASMVEMAGAYGTLFVEVQKEWLEAKLAASLEGIPGNAPVPDESGEHLVINSSVHRQLRRHLYGLESPIQFDDAIARRLLNRPIKDNLGGRDAAIHQLDLANPGSPPRAMVLSEDPVERLQYVFRRGNPLNRGEVVTPGFLSVLSAGDPSEYPTGKLRLALAKSITDPTNPLTRRVIVNWVWGHHFGEGLVRTPDDFGTRGDRPTHPQLLDYLADKLLQDGWSLKKLHRRIMLSDTYQQAAREDSQSRERDPENRLLWRMPRRRLDWEAMRDATLAVSGELQLQDRGGRPFELLSNPAVPRRSVYAFINRDIIDPLLSTFDGANPNSCTAQRPRTSVPQQTLFALNSEFIQNRAKALADEILANGNSEQPRELQIRELFRRTLGRDPQEDELRDAISFLKSPPKNRVNEKSETQYDLWRQLSHVLIASNEFVFVD
jgi:mono/diheme cytochrome c family protein